LPSVLLLSKKNLLCSLQVSLSIGPTDVSALATRTEILMARKEKVESYETQLRDFFIDGLPRFNFIFLGLAKTVIRPLCSPILRH
jgi:hypothetical protein